MKKRNRSGRKYRFEQFSCPTKIEVLELFEAKGEITSAELAKLMRIKLVHAAKLNMTYWREGLLHHETEPMRAGGLRYVFTLTKSGRTKLEFFRREHNLTALL